MSKVYFLKRVQKIPAGIDEVWSFFSNAGNLAAITPASLSFKIDGRNEEVGIYAGQIIEYRLKPLLGIPVYWMTEITQVKEHIYFVDEQRFGPYSLWHHQHHFKDIINGIEMTDIVHYKIPFWLLGDIANALIVKNKLAEIFDYRRKIIEERFGKWE